MSFRNQTIDCFFVRIGLNFLLNVFIIVNLALHRRTYQMSTRITEYPSDKLVDGKVLTGHISHGACTSTLDEKVVAMWIVDLKKPRRIERINVFSRTDNLTWGKKYFKICKINKERNV